MWHKPREGIKQEPFYEKERYSGKMVHTIIPGRIERESDTLFMQKP